LFSIETHKTVIVTGFMLRLTKIERTLTGIPGLDEMLGGGFTRGRVILVLGEPGAGKTIMCSQFLLNGIQKFGEKGLFVSLEENKQHYSDEMGTFGWDIAGVEKSGELTFIDASPIRSLSDEVQVGGMSIGKSDFSLVSLLEVIKNRALSTGVKRIVVDPISHLIFQFSDGPQRRKALLDLVEALAKTGATCLLASELREVGGTTRRLQLEEYLVHGVIILQSKSSGRSLERIIQVEKMRGSSIDRSPKPYRITEDGIEVYPKESVI
jgi:KaiC/GvpD/RAD55 family RecA-like ATPase